MLLLHKATRSLTSASNRLDTLALRVRSSNMVDTVRPFSSIASGEAPARRRAEAAESARPATAATKGVLCRLSFASKSAPWRRRADTLTLAATALGL